MVNWSSILAGQDSTVVGSGNSTISTGSAAAAAFRNAGKTSNSALLVRAADSLTLASPVDSGDSIYALEYPVNSDDSSKTLDRTLASLVHSGDIIKTKAAKTKAGIEASTGPTASKFLATTSPVYSGDSSRTLASPVHSGDIIKTKADRLKAGSVHASPDQKAAKLKAGSVDASPNQKSAKLKAGSVDASLDQKSAKPKAGIVKASPDQTAATFLASSLVDSGDSSPAPKESVSTDQAAPDLTPTLNFLKLDCFRFFLAAPFTINRDMTDDD